MVLTIEGFRAVTGLVGLPFFFFFLVRLRVSVCGGAKLTKLAALVSSPLFSGQDKEIQRFFILMLIKKYLEIRQNLIL